MLILRRAAPLLAVAAVAGCASVLQTGVSGAPKVGPPNGSVVVVGGGVIGSEVLTRFIELAGGPDALIIDVPTAGGDSVYPAEWRGMNALKAAGAKNVVVLHTIDKKVADSDAFAEPLARAGGVWFEGGRQWHLVDSYGGTKTERGFHSVLARGGVVGGSSAGASILASYMLRGAREGNTIIMAPGYEVGFGFLRGVAIDQHVLARERLRDLADSLMPKHPELLGISEDEGTAWIVRGDIAEIVGRSKAFVYGGRDATDDRKPFLTLYPGDRYDLAARRVTQRASDGSPLTRAFVDSLFRSLPGKATVLVARQGKVLVNAAYGVPDHPTYMPGTSVPNFALGGVASVVNALAARFATEDGKLTLDDPLSDSINVKVREYLTPSTLSPGMGRRFTSLVAKRTGTPYPQFITRRIGTPVGWHRTDVDTLGLVSSNVDELYRLALGLDGNKEFTQGSDPSLGWRVDAFRGQTRWSAYGTPAGKQNAFVRLPGSRVSIIVLTNVDAADARGIAERIAEKMLEAR